MPATTFIGHFLGPDTHANRPSATGLPNGTLYVCTTHSKIERVVSGAWADYATLGAAGGVPTDTIWDAKGDLAVASGADTAARLAVGSNGQVLQADSAQTLGVKWTTLPSGGMVADPLWDAKGDLAVATGPDAATRLAVGSDGQVLTADSAQSAGVKWAAAGGGSSSLTLISTTTLASQGGFDISSIPGTYNDLIFVLVARSSATAGPDNLAAPMVRLNNDSGASYNWNFIKSRTTVVNAIGDITDYTRFQPGFIPRAAATSGYFGVVEMTIYNYAGTTAFKTVQWNSYGAGGNSGGALQITAGGGVWAQTAAVTRLVVDGDAGDRLQTGSQLRIYGRL